MATQKKKVKRPLKRMRTEEVAKMPVYPLAAMFPNLNRRGSHALARDMKENGQAVPLLAWKNQLIDGCQRLGAAQLAKLESLLVMFCDDLTEAQVRKKIRSLGIKRRSLTPGQKANLALEEYYLARETKNKLSVEQAAELYDASPRTVHRYKAARENGAVSAKADQPLPKKKRRRMEQIEKDLLPTVDVLLEMDRIKEADKAAYMRFKLEFYALTEKIDSHLASLE